MNLLDQQHPVHLICKQNTELLAFTHQHLQEARQHSTQSLLTWKCSQIYPCDTIQKAIWTIWKAIWTFPMYLFPLVINTLHMSLAFQCYQKLALHRGCPLVEDQFLLTTMLYTSLVPKLWREWPVLFLEELSRARKIGIYLTWQIGWEKLLLLVPILALTNSKFHYKGSGAAFPYALAFKPDMPFH